MALKLPPCPDRQEALYHLLPLSKDSYLANDDADDQASKSSLLELDSVAF